MRKSIEKLPNDFSVLSGNDDQNLDILKLGRWNRFGAFECFSTRDKKLSISFVRGDIASAESLSNLLADFVDALFIETNPIPVKQCWHISECEEIFRLPLTTMDPKTENAY